MGLLSDGGMMKFPNVVLPGQRADALRGCWRGVGTARWCRWRDLDWIRRSWPGPIVVKGVLTADDTRRAMDKGAAATWSSRTMAGGSSTACRRR